MTYDEFLATKRLRAHDAGFPVQSLHPALFDFQHTMVTLACQRGRSAIFAECGLGKTLVQLNWANEVVRHTGQAVLILTPLAVAAQTIDEAHKFGYVAHRIQRDAEVQPQAINVCNYDRLKDLKPERFAGIVLDESSILKAFSGITKRQLVEAFAATPYRLCCTATPAPNDHTELGNHAEFLGIMESHRMLARWFINDSMHAGQYRLKGHAAGDFWRWLTTWAVAADKPSDLGGDDRPLTIPPLRFHVSTVVTDPTVNAGDQLIRVPDLSATGLHRELRLTAPLRATRCADVVHGRDGPWLIWCHTDYEAEAIRPLIPDLVEVRGSESVAAKERKLLGFARGEFRILLTKPAIAGFGLNYQHCHQMAFLGVSYSYELLYQALRRSWRYGQSSPVEAYLIVADSEGPVLQTLLRKQRDHLAMKVAMVAAMRGELAA